MDLAAKEIAEYIQGELIGTPDIRISCLSSLDDIKPGALVFCDSERNVKRAVDSTAAVILTNKLPPENTYKTFIIVEKPFLAFIELMKRLHPPVSPKPGIHPNSSIGNNVKLGSNIHIGAFVSIGDNCTIGDNAVIHSQVALGTNVTLGHDSTLHPQVVIYNDTQIGNFVTIHGGSVIGSDGFGYLEVNDQLVKIPHIGNVIIDDHVEIGANSAIDRATVGSTHIGKHSKVDNLVQIAHNVQIGESNRLCAFTGIAGSSTLGNRVTCGAGVGIADHVTVSDNVMLAARAGVPPKKHLQCNMVYLGSPARPFEKGIEQELSVTRIPSMRKKLTALSERVNTLWSKFNMDEIN